MKYCSLDLSSITSHTQNWVLFVLWLYHFILSGVISPLFSSSILGTYQPGEFSVLSFCLFILFLGDSWTLMGKSGSVSCGVTDPFSWVLVHTKFCLCPPRVCFPSPCKFWRLFGGVNGDLLQEGLRHTQDCCTQSPCPCRRPLLTCTFTGETQTQLGSVSVGSLGPGVHKVCLSPLSISGGYGV